jgi:hypothetical protein
MEFDRIANSTGLSEAERLEAQRESSATRE